MELKRHQKVLVWACVAALAVWLVAPLRAALLPLIYYNTYVHELCHALAGLLTGGVVEFVRIHADGSGVTQTVGGNPVMLSSSGYVGSAVVGGMLVYLSRTEKGARRMLWVAAGFIGGGLLLFVRGDTVGVLAGVAWLLALGASALLMPGNAAVFTAQFLGVQQCLTSLYAFLALVKISAGDLGHSDAANMEAVTGIPAVLWSLAWMLLGIVAVGIGLRASWQNPPK